LKRGEIWLVEYDPARGSEANKTRPSIIVSNRNAVIVVERLHRGVLSVVPLTKNTKFIQPFQALIPADAHTGLDTPSKAQCEQIRSVDFSRLVTPLGELGPEEMAAVDDAILIQFGLD
jgi:mRNA interferase MazF